ncbi:Uncharacterised protein [Candidatus Tiddalikarchaeum anstoanum]|nr:Uncharacterised protein [Candidatus Tiddalikarchaeum anstoanum]
MSLTTKVFHFNHERNAEKFSDIYWQVLKEYRLSDLSAKFPSTLVNKQDESIPTYCYLPMEPLKYNAGTLEAKLVLKTEDMIFPAFLENTIRTELDGKDVRLTILRNDTCVNEYFKNFDNANINHIDTLWKKAEAFSKNLEFMDDNSQSCLDELASNISKDKKYTAIIIKTNNDTHCMQLKEGNSNLGVLFYDNRTKSFGAEFNSANFLNLIEKNSTQNGELHKNLIEQLVNYYNCGDVSINKTITSIGLGLNEFLELEIGSSREEDITNETYDELGYFGVFIQSLKGSLPMKIYSNSTSQTIDGSQLISLLKKGDSLDKTLYNNINIIETRDSDKPFIGEGMVDALALSAETVVGLAITLPILGIYAAIKGSFRLGKKIIEKIRNKTTSAVIYEFTDINNIKKLVTPYNETTIKGKIYDNQLLPDQKIKSIAPNAKASKRSVKKKSKQETAVLPPPQDFPVTYIPTRSGENVKTAMPTKEQINYFLDKEAEKNAGTIVMPKNEVKIIKESLLKPAPLPLTPEIIKANQPNKSEEASLLKQEDKQKPENKEVKKKTTKRVKLTE